MVFLFIFENNHLTDFHLYMYKWKNKMADSQCELVLFQSPIAKPKLAHRHPNSACLTKLYVLVDSICKESASSAKRKQNETAPRGARHSQIAILVLIFKPKQKPKPPNEHPTSA